MVVISIPTTISKEISSTTFVTCLDTKSTVMLEFQGAVEKDGSSWAGNALGQLSILEGGVKAQLVVGNHRLEGKVVKLDKPLLLIQKQKAGDTEGQGSSSVRLGGNGKGTSTDSGLDSESRGRRPPRHDDDTMTSAMWPKDVPESSATGVMVDPIAPSSCQSCIEYDTVAIIRQKILFNTMPVPIIHAERRGLTVIKRGV
ncbi:hypothetical protein B0O80DRAFT_452571 [Mortierella sp. GBAus27b]|nr:hypothetical protein B0O80DRAFT_452571 [Mortierella sp. GBAus27b]